MFVRKSSSADCNRQPSVGLFLNSISTPAPVLRTFLGNPLYTTPDAIDEIPVDDPYFGQLDIADLVYKDFKGTPLSDLCKPFKQVQQILSGRQSGKKFDSNCDAGGMSLDTHCGRKVLSVQQFIERVSVDKPNVLIPLADEVQG